MKTFKTFQATNLRDHVFIVWLVDVILHQIYRKNKGQLKLK